MSLLYDATNTATAFCHTRDLLVEDALELAQQIVGCMALEVEGDATERYVRDAWKRMEENHEQE